MSSTRCGSALCLGVVLALTVGRDAQAYIDPGTGGTVFSSLAPIVGILVVVFLATLRFTWVYVRAALAFLWRHRLWCALVLAIVALAAAWLGARLLGAEHATGAPAGPAGLGSPGRPAGAPHGEGATPATHRAVERFVKEHGMDFRPADRFRLLPSAERPEILRCRYELDHRVRNCLVLDRNGQLETTVVPAAGQRLRLHVAAVFPGDDKKRGEVRFSCQAVRGGSEGLLFAQEWKSGTADSRWQGVSLDLPGPVGEPLTLRFTAAVKGGGVCLLSDPHLVGGDAPARPNVVLCTIETLRRDHTSLYGYGRATTPFLEALAKESLVFEEAYSQSSWTKPSMATVLTGLYASQHGTVQGTDRLPGAFVLISELLREAGYATAACCGCETISKPTFNYDQGFDLFVDEGSATFEKTRQDALEWLAADEGRPFFLFIHVFDPHEPYDAPLPFRDVFDPQYDGRLKAVSALSPSGSAVRAGLTDRDRQYIKARYDAEIYYVDTVLEGLVARLKERGLWDDTLLVVTSDHGEEFGEHGDWGHGKTLFPQSLAVPLLIKLPAQAHGGRRVLGLAGGVDIVPTILAALGVDVPAYLPGVDLLESAVRTGRTSRQAHAAELWDIGADRRGEPAYSIISEGFQFILPRAYAPETQYLFNLREDPSGRTNLISSRLDVAERLRLMVEQRYGCVGYTLAANGSGAGPHVFSVTVTSEAAIMETEGVRIEPDDVVLVSDDARSMHVRLTVAQDDDAVRFRTEPPNVPVTIAVQLDGADAPAELVRLGPSGEAPKRLPLAVPAQRSDVDADTSEARLYKVGGELGLFIWRNGTPRGSQAADLDEETLRSLKELGYL